VYRHNYNTEADGCQLFWLANCERRINTAVAIHNIQTRKGFFFIVYYISRSKYTMRFTKQQQEVLDNLMVILSQMGRAYLLGWLLGLVIKLATHDPNLRRYIKQKAQE
jgi:hypothetical protein